MPPEENIKPSDTPACRPNDDSISRSASSSNARVMRNGSPCCGKRPRTPRTAESQYQSQDGMIVIGTAFDQETQKPAAAASASASASAAQLTNQQDGEIIQNYAETAAVGEEEEEEEEYEGEPYAKMARSSPIEIPSDNDDDSDDDEELLRINQQKQQQQQQPPPPSQQQPQPQYRKEKAHQGKTTTTTKEDQQELDSKPPATRRKKTRWEQEASSLLLPLAANLREFMKPGATKLFTPRPEWYMGDQNGNPNSLLHHHRRRARPPTPAIPQHHHQQQQQQQGVPPFPVAAAAAATANLHFPLPPGLMLAPDTGLLPDGIFDVFVNPRDPVVAPFFGDQHRAPPPPPPAAAAPAPMMAADNPSEAAANQEETDDDENNNNRRQNRRQQLQQQQQQIPLLSTFGRDFDPALHVTIRETATEAAMALLEWGAPVEAENAKGVTPLILAAQKGNAFLVRELLRRGAPPSRASSNGTTAVLQAAHFGHLECLELLFQAGGVALMEMANFNHTTPLMRAAQEGHVRIVQMLLDRGAAVNRRNRVQMTALMLASQRGHGKVCQVLVNKGAELDSMTAQHSTSLLLACKRGHVDVVRVLVTAGCELWVQDSRGRTAREVAQRREMKDLVPYIDSNVQLDLMQRQQRKKRNYDMVLLWNLLQKERAMVPLHKEGEEPTTVPPASRQVTIHQMMQELQNPKKLTLSMNSQCNLPPTLPYHLSKKSTQALLRTMSLPAPLVELIAKFMPMPPMWERRLGMLTRRSVINADATVTCALDLIDEILEEGGFVEACDVAQVVPPTHFASWRDWKIHCRLKCQRGGAVQLPEDTTARPIATNATVPKPKDTPSVLEMRRQVGFLQILANRTPVLAHVLGRQPYNMPRPLIQQLITTSDIQSLVRRMGSRGVHFEATVAMDLIMLVSRLISWYSREREDKPYPIYPAVVHPPLSQPRQRPLPMRVPLEIVHAPFQYDPYQIQQPVQQAVAAVRERPPAPRPV